MNNKLKAFQIIFMGQSLKNNVWPIIVSWNEMSKQYTIGNEISLKMLETCSKYQWLVGSQNN